MDVTTLQPPRAESKVSADGTPSSGRKTAAARARAATRERLLESGQALFAEQGLHKVTTHDIAAHAGVAAGTFYNHFPDKHALFRELVDAAVDELHRRVELARDESAPLPDRLRAHATAMIDFAEDNRDMIRVVFSGDADSAQVEHDVLDRLARSVADVRRQFIASGQLPGVLDPEVVSQAVVGMWARVFAWWAEDPSRAPRETVIETLTGIQLHGTYPVGTADAAPSRSGSD
jgi:AcrR family transcriptional regulator